VQPLPTAYPGAGIAFVVAVALFAITEAFIRAISRRNIRITRGSRGGERKSLLVLVAAFALGIGAAFLLSAAVPAAAIPVGRFPLFVAGLVLMALGVALRWWSVAVLGASFTIDVRVRADQEVVSRGPYRAVRHPAYSALLLSCLGIGLCLGNWLSILAAVVPAACALIFRIRVEEEALIAELGEAYRRYAVSRARLVPFIW
jgi:protein-S-isoprenylcysteine O-methyltransferase Ste14